MASRCFALIPSAGFGSRAGAPMPKQYMRICGAPMLVHTLRAFLGCRRIDAVRVVFAPDDPWPASSEALALLGESGGRLTFSAVGGATRARSVANGLAVLTGEAQADDWVLVHDAARPCITSQTIEALVDALFHDPIGGLLAVPLADTLKRADSAGRVEVTIPRENLWRAQTPQMFRLATLVRAYAATADTTDEAGAIEAFGLAPKLVPGPASNLKVTYPEDFAVAETFLAARRGAGGGANR